MEEQTIEGEEIENMKIREINWAEGKIYRDNNAGEEWVTYKTPRGVSLKNKYGADIVQAYSLKTITKMDFEEVVDWSKVDEDTPVLVKHNHLWIRRRFSHFDKINNAARVFTDGTDSYTTFQISENHRYDEYILSEIKLYKEEK